MIYCCLLNNGADRRNETADVDGLSPNHNLPFLHIPECKIPRELVFILPDGALKRHVCIQPVCGIKLAGLPWLISSFILDYVRSALLRWVAVGLWHRLTVRVHHSRSSSIYSPLCSQLIVLIPLK